MLLSERLQLYLVTDEALSKGRSTKEVVEAAVLGGATCVQLREKHASSRYFLETAQQLCLFLRQQNVLFIINDRIDIALAVDADGVHLGQTDIPLPIARKLLPAKIIGITVHTIEEAIAAEKNGANYLGISPIFDTPTKTDTPPALGIKGLQEIRKHTTLPLVAIGGITLQNASEILLAGADSLAIVSALVSATDITQAAQQFSDIIFQVKNDSHS